MSFLILVTKENYNSLQSFAGYNWKKNRLFLNFTCYITNNARMYSLVIVIYYFQFKECGFVKHLVTEHL